MGAETILPRDSDNSSKTSMPDCCQSILDFIGKTYSNREIYNVDNTRKFVCKKELGEDTVTKKIGMFYKICDVWMPAMCVEIGEDAKGNRNIFLDVGVSNRLTKKVSMQTYRYNQSGKIVQKSDIGGGSHYISDSEISERIRSQGFEEAENLPKFIDFEETVKRFLNQARTTNFSRPILIPHTSKGN